MSNEQYTCVFVGPWTEGYYAFYTPFTHKTCILAVGKAQRCQVSQQVLPGSCHSCSTGSLNLKQQSTVKNCIVYMFSNSTVTYNWASVHQLVTRHVPDEPHCMFNRSVHFHWWAILNIVLFSISSHRLPVKCVVSFFFFIFAYKNIWLLEKLILFSGPTDWMQCVENTVVLTPLPLQKNEKKLKLQQQRDLIWLTLNQVQEWTTCPLFVQLGNWKKTHEFKKKKEIKLIYAFTYSFKNNLYFFPYLKSWDVSVRPRKKCLLSFLLFEVYSFPIELDNCVIHLESCLS